MARGRKAKVVETGPVEKPWELPEGWRWARLGSHADLVRGVSYSKGQAREVACSSHVPLLRGNNIQDGSLRLSDLVHVQSSCVSDVQYLRAGDIVLTMSSGSAALVGKSAFVKAVSEPITFGAFCGCIRAVEGIDSKWTHWFLQTGFYRAQVSASAKGTNINNLKREHLLSLPMPVPPLDTQRRIVARIDELFSELDDGEAALARARADLETYRKSLLKAAVTGELTADWRAANPPAETGEQLLQRILADRKARWDADPKNKGKRYKEPKRPETDGLPELPDGWTWISLEQLSSPEKSSISDGPFGSNLKSEHYQSSGPRVIRLQNIGQAGNFVDAKAHVSADHHAMLERHHVKSGDVVVAILGEPLPRAVIIPEDFGEGLVKADCIKVRIASEDLRLLAWAWLNNPVAHSFVAHSVKGVGRPRIGMDQIKGMPVPLPGREELRALLLILSEALEQRKQSRQLLDAFSGVTPTLRQSILAAAFRGELVQ